MKKTVIILIILVLFSGCNITQPDAFGIIGFSFDRIYNPELLFPVVATISGTSITAALPFDTDLTSLAPTITITADAEIMPQSGSVMNFTMPVFFIVTSIDKTKSLTYTAVVTLEEEE